MSRYFKAEQINPNNDFLYKAPHELMAQALQVQQQGYDNMVASTDMFSSLDINHINDPNVQKRVAEIKDMYEGRAEEILSEIKKDSKNWVKMKAPLRKLSSQLQTDLKSGALANIQGSYNNWQKFLENNKDKDKYTLDLAKRHYINQYKNSVETNADTYMTFDDITNPVNLMSKEYQDILSKIKANKSTTTDGMYIYNNETITAERAEQVAYDLLMADPQFRDYSNQQAKFGDLGYVEYDDEGNIMKDQYGNNMKKSLYSNFDSNGNMISRDEAEKLHSDWMKLSDEEKKKTPYPTRTGLNPTHAMSAGLKAMGRTYSFFSQDMKVDEYGKIKTQFNNDVYLKNLGFSHDVAKLRLKQEFDIALEDKKAEAEVAKIMLEKGIKTEDRIFELKKLQATTKDPKSKKEIGDLITQQSANEITGVMYGDQNLTFDTMLVNARNGDEGYINLRGQIRNEARKATNLKPGTNEHYRAMLYDGYRAQGLNEEQAMAKVVEDSYKREIQSKTRNGKPISFSSERQMEDFRKEITTGLGNYQKNMNNSLDNLKTRTNHIVMNPLSITGISNAEQVIKNEPTAFRVLDDRGKVIKDYDINNLANSDFKASHAFGSNPQSDIGVSGTLTINGVNKKVNIVPSDKGTVESNTLRNGILYNGLKDPKNSSLMRSYTLQDAQKIESALFKSLTDKSGNKTIRVTIDGGKHNSWLRQFPDGSVGFSLTEGVDFSKNPDKGGYHLFPDVHTLTQFVSDID